MAPVPVTPHGRTDFVGGSTPVVSPSGDGALPVVGPQIVVDSSVVPASGPSDAGAAATTGRLIDVAIVGRTPSQSSRGTEHELRQNASEPAAPVVSRPGSLSAEVASAAKTGPKVTGGASEPEAAAEALPEPGTAGLITGFLPFRLESLDASISRFLGRFDELSGVSAADGAVTPNLLPVVTGVLAFEAARRWRRRRTISLNAPPVRLASRVLHGFS